MRQNFVSVETLRMLQSNLCVYILLGSKTYLSHAERIHATTK